MKIFFSKSSAQGKQTERITRSVVDALTRCGSEIVDASYKPTVKDRGQFPMQAIDGFVIDANYPNDEMAYLLAFAVLQKKPVLCISSGKMRERIVADYLNLTEIPKFIVFQDALPSIGSRVESFVHRYIVEPVHEMDIPSIKFTLRVTPRIDQYFYWKTHNKDLSKADFVRIMLEREIKNDADYQSFIAQNNGRWSEKNDHS